MALEPPDCSAGAQLQSADKSSTHKFYILNLFHLLQPTSFNLLFAKMTDMEIDNSPVNKDVDDGKKKEKKRFELKKVGLSRTT